MKYRICRPWKQGSPGPTITCCWRDFRHRPYQRRHPQHRERREHGGEQRQRPPQRLLRRRRRRRGLLLLLLLVKEKKKIRGGRRRGIGQKKRSRAIKLERERVVISNSSIYIFLDDNFKPGRRIRIRINRKNLVYRLSLHAYFSLVYRNTSKNMSMQM